jgi:predicted DNA-binding protein with PD1-like motif
MNAYRVKRTFMGQLQHGADLLESLTQIVQRENIRLGRVSALGATTRAVVAYYDQSAKQYSSMTFDDGMEILNLHGNISMRDGKPFVHLHVLLSDRQGKVFGGHVMPGTTLFACEVFVEEMEGEELVRGNDERTGLFLWKSGYLS